MITPPHALRAVLTDVRANMEASLRVMTAMDVCVERYALDGDMLALHEIAKHLQTMGDLHEVTGDLGRAAEQALASLMVTSGSAAPKQ